MLLNSNNFEKYRWLISLMEYLLTAYLILIGEIDQFNGVLTNCNHRSLFGWESNLRFQRVVPCDVDDQYHPVLWHFVEFQFHVWLSLEPLSSTLKLYINHQFLNYFLILLFNLWLHFVCLIYSVAFFPGDWDSDYDINILEPAFFKYYFCWSVLSFNHQSNKID